MYVWWYWVYMGTSEPQQNLTFCLPYWAKRAHSPFTYTVDCVLQEKHLELNTMNVEELKAEMVKVVGSAKVMWKGNKEVKKLAVLRAWFEKMIAPNFKDTTNSSPEATTKSSPKATTKSSSKATTKSSSKAPKTVAGPSLKDLECLKSEILPGEISEEPELLAKILMFSQEWLDLILSGKKTIELRKARISCSNQYESYYMGFGNVIYGRCMVAPGVKIENDEDFSMLKDGHLWTNPQLPYSFPFFAHGLSKVQRLKPLEFEKLFGTQGRALYRPLGYLEEHAEGKEIEEQEEGGGSTADKKTKGKQVKKGAKGKKGVINDKTKRNQIKCLPPAGLKARKVEVVDVDPNKYLQPDAARLEGKLAHLKATCQGSANLHVSGGLLAHFNNVAFCREEAETAAYLVGHEEKGSQVVTGVWVPSWDMQKTFHSWTLEEPALLEWCANSKKTNTIVMGICLVAPREEKPASDKITMFDSILKNIPEGFFVGLVGSDRKCTFYGIQDGQWKELACQVHWLGQRSLYMEHVVSKHAALVDTLKAEAIQGVPRKRYTKSAKEKQQEQNKARCMMKEDERLENGHITAERHIQNNIEELQHIADFLLENLTKFDAAANPAMMECFADYLNKYPGAKTELSKAGKKISIETVAEAGQCMSTVLQLKGALQMRAARRVKNDTHTFDGVKWSKRRKLASSTCSGSTKRSDSFLSSSEATQNAFSQDPHDTHSSWCGVMICKPTYIYIVFISI